jgi:uncharacterized protein with ATP-grasp and redox domains
MNSSLDCIPCFIEHTLHVAKMVTDNEHEQFDIVRQAMGEVSKMELEQSPPEMARTIHGIIRQVTGVEDAYSDIKDQSTDFALKLLPFLREDLEMAKDRFEAIVRIAIAGNIIDFGADRNFKLETAHHRIAEAFTAPVDQDAIRKLKQLMESSENILYLMDNCGEAVFDRLLIELYPEKITIAVRGYPILNDITPREVESSGLNNLAKRIINTGDATPGVSLRYASDEFLEAFNQADLIISKGQGNFESLSETDRPIAFLLRAKCKVISRLLDDVELGSLQVILKNL